jgi:hypothetical protein
MDSSVDRTVESWRMRSRSPPFRQDLGSNAIKQINSDKDQLIKKLQAELHKAKADASKEKALLLQESEHLKLEREDIAERLESEKSMNHKMMSALNGPSESDESLNDRIKELEKTLRDERINHETEISSFKAQLDLKIHQIKEIEKDISNENNRERSCEKHLQERLDDKDDRISKLERNLKESDLVWRAELDHQIENYFATLEKKSNEMEEKE